jgi:hypothetical protein
MQVRTRLVLLTIFMFASTIQVMAQTDWGQFRGPHGAGIASDSKGLPATFNESTNLVWKSAMPHGLSSPCISGDRIFLTGITGTDLETVCVDRKTGNVSWRRPAWYEFVERVHRVNSPATPTPCTDGERVFVYIGSSGLMCYDFDGNEIWSRQMRTPPNLYGTAASPIMAGDYLIFVNDNQRESSLEAIDPTTGETAWQVMREGFKSSWSTPMHWHSNGVDELVVYGVWWMKAYDLATVAALTTPITVNAPESEPPLALAAMKRGELLSEGKDVSVIDAIMDLLVSRGADPGCVD